MVRAIFHSVWWSDIPAFLDSKVPNERHPEVRFRVVLEYRKFPDVRHLQSLFKLEGIR